MDGFLLSTGVVALAEVGDKTQLLAFLLAARYRKPLPIIIGILIATIANHALAGLVGTWLSSLVSAETLRWILGASFIAMAAWILVPDEIDEEEDKTSQFGVLLHTILVFFMAEMGDKTQIATVALAAQYQNLWAVIAGTTLGMMIANVPAVLLGEKAAHALPIRWVHAGAAALFALLGVGVLLS